MVRKSFVLVLVLFLAPLISAVAQSNELEDHFLAEKQADYATSIYFVLAAANIVPPTATVKDSMSTLSQKHWGLLVPAKPGSIRFGDLALVLMHAFQIPGGIFYSWFPNTRYATHEIVYRGFAGSTWGPDKILTPDEVLRVLNAVLAWKEGQ